MAEAIYLLCAVTSLVATVLLLRQYQARRSPLLVWSCIGFFGLAVNNMLAFADFALMTEPTCRSRVRWPACARAWSCSMD